MRHQLSVRTVYLLLTQDVCYFLLEYVEKRRNSNKENTDVGFVFTSQYYIACLEENTFCFQSNFCPYLMAACCCAFVFIEKVCYQLGPFGKLIFGVLY